MIKKTPFKLKSGNVTPFKMMGSSPVKQHSQEEDVIDVVGDVVEGVVTKPEDEDVVRAKRFTSVSSAESEAQALKNKAARKQAITEVSTDVRTLSKKELNKQIKAQKEHLRSVGESGYGESTSKMKRLGIFAGKKKKQAWLAAQLMKGIDVGSHYEGGENE